MYDVFVPLEEGLRLLFGAITFLCLLLYLAGGTAGVLAPIGRRAFRGVQGRTIPLLGLMVLVASPALARPRGHRPPVDTQLTPSPPWSGSIGYPPPRLLVRTEAPPSPATEAHPGIHGRKGYSARRGERLFTRAGASFESAGRRESMRRHPSGRSLASPVTCGDTYTVTSGDALWSIAARALGTEDPRRIARYWPRIHRLNRAVIGADPSLIYPGQVLRLPPECSP
ncbi:MAG: LysM peptidoglycan-binding domain-containing protein [Actinomycetota bacterium]|nr:LysM peptidoglycan-binding domain-containing protein [Actinomycetota bacterium]